MHVRLAPCHMWVVFSSCAAVKAKENVLMNACPNPRVSPGPMQRCDNEQEHSLPQLSGCPSMSPAIDPLRRVSHSQIAIVV